MDAYYFSGDYYKILSIELKYMFVTAPTGMRHIERKHFFTKMLNSNRWIWKSTPQLIVKIKHSV